MRNHTIPLICLAIYLAGPAAFAERPEGKGPPTGEASGNNLSFPVIWAEGVKKPLPPVPNPGEVILEGEWFYQWGTNGSDPNITPAYCLPDPDNDFYCDDEVADMWDEALVPGIPPADNPMDLAMVYVQKDSGNAWQAGSGTPTESGVAEEDGQLWVHWIDWGDNLESVDWYTKSMVRTEVVLFQENPAPEPDPRPDYNPWLEYEMRHVSGWGIDEVHGLNAAPLNTDPLSGEPVIGPGTRATVYTHCARLTIQKLLFDRDDPALQNLAWVPGEGWTEGCIGGTYSGPCDTPDGQTLCTSGEGVCEVQDLINEPIFNGSVHDGGDGPAYYSAEINVKGRIIFGYTWNVRRLHDDTPVPPGNVPSAAGDYRITFSLDTTCGTTGLNTYFVDGVTNILLPVEETQDFLVSTEGEEPVGGGTGVLDYTNNLTYMDIRILERGGGGGGGGGQEGGGGKVIGIIKLGGKP